MNPDRPVFSNGAAASICQPVSGLVKAAVAPYATRFGVWQSWYLLLEDLLRGTLVNEMYAFLPEEATLALATSRRGQTTGLVESSRNSDHV